MCDFRPGDEVICVDARSYDPVRMPSPLVKGATYTIEMVDVGTGISCLPGADWRDEVFVMLVGLRSDTRSGGFAASRFRKGQRRDLQCWLKTSVPNTDHLDKPLPAKKRERVAC